jgi:AraC-like DNA-binding protein
MEIPVLSRNGDSRVDQAVDFLKSHWKSVRTLQEVATDFEIDAANLTRRFRESEGKTPKRFLDEERKRFVLERLRENEMLGYEIGALLEFPSDIAFYRWVKRVFGRSLKELQDDGSVLRRRGLDSPDFT